MSWLGRAISSVGQYYKEINPATLSGAIDVIVVSTKRPSDESGEADGTLVEDLACSPWHVRFGKLSVLRPVERKVRILINDQPAPFSMKIGETGEAFFVFETDVDDLPDDLQTSPLVSPCLQAVEPSKDRISTELEVVPDFNDLGESELAGEPGEWSEQNSNIQDSCETVHSSPVSLPIRFKSEDGTQTSHGSVEADGGVDLKENPATAQQDEETIPQLGIGTIIPSMKVETDDQSCPSEPHEDGDEVRDAVRAQDSELASPVCPASDTHFIPHHLHQGTNLPSGDLMLDMDGYKMSEDTEEDLSRPNNIPESQFLAIKKIPHKTHSTPPLSSPSSSSQGDDNGANANEGQVMAFTKALLTCSERINNMLSPTDSASASQIAQKVEVMIDSIENEAGSSDLTPPKLADNKVVAGVDEDPDCIFSVERVEGANGLGSYDRFKLKCNRASHVFELSLYNPFDNQQDQPGRTSNSHHRGLRRPFNRQKFDENRISFEDFFTQDQTRRKGEIDEEANIIVKYNELFFLSWDNASTALTSLAILRKSVLNLKKTKTLRVINGAARIVPDSPIKPKKDSHADVPGEASAVQSTFETERAADKLPSPTPTTYSRPWSRWWYKSDRLSSAQMQQLRYHSEEPFSSNTQSQASDQPRGAHDPAPVSPPQSPRSLPAQFEADLTEPRGGPGQSSARQRSTSAHPSETEKEPAPTRCESSPPRKHYAKTLRLTSDQLKQLDLKKGMNTVSFSVRSSYSGFAVCTSRIFLWDSDFKICISDIDGTITKSDALGHVFTMIGRDWTHAGVAKLYTDIARNGYKLMYLTSRAIGQADTTREYLKGINQMGYTLPDGPVIMSPDRLMTSLHREVIMRKPEVFKMACLRDIQRLFGPNRKPFYAGFGNRITDALSYRTVEIPSSRIFTIDPNGEVKMELLELTGYKSSYIHMTDLVDQMFPPINRSSSMPEYTDFNFWRVDLGTTALLNDLDLNELLAPTFAQQLPASPALSARSIESTTAVSRLSFRLASLSLGRKASKPDLVKPAAAPKRGLSPSGLPAKPLDTDATSVRSWDTISRVIEEDSEVEDVVGAVPARMRSDSMPGSLPGSLEEQTLLESLRSEAFEINPRRKRVSSGATAAEAAGEGVGADGAEGEEEEDAEEGETNVEEDDDFPQMDFSAVPVRR
ncbi:hypothetical protein CROQUDRAFT_39727 [Cronartium quercuum f. sp. fusiforme G11]|uniref:LNS2/PITP domain-containing protein n=1 Tax=Cronartium quercuum f. sp. fusiforme G11 TaxID=708437 RepID=A0A9P6NU01_9BASI|nr:hypothetical protein CROQUDRAFT_39727 [Cronartium quercuum f. sp. fusiforme G11]